MVTCHCFEKVEYVLKVTFFTLTVVIRKTTVMLYSACHNNITVSSCLLHYMCLITLVTLQEEYIK